MSRKRRLRRIGCDRKRAFPSIADALSFAAWIECKLPPENATRLRAEGYELTRDHAGLREAV